MQLFITEERLATAKAFVLRHALRHREEHALRCNLSPCAEVISRIVHRSVVSIEVPHIVNADVHTSLNRRTFLVASHRHIVH